MDMKRFTFILIVMIQGLGCENSSDPDTVNRAELSPPLNLTTVTGDTTVELRWFAQNFEEELSGYHVFIAADQTVATLSSSAPPAYPPSVDIAQGSVPRCEDNNAFFKVFGLNVESTSTCGGGILSLTEKKPRLRLVDDDKNSILDALKICYDPTDPEAALGIEKQVSLAKGTSAFNNGQGIQRCLIKGLENGRTYLFLVVAVLGEDYDEISWSSNVAEDTPAKLVYTGELDLAEATFNRIVFDGSTAAGGAVLDSSNTNCSVSSGTLCKLGGTNAQGGPGDATAVFFGRDDSSNSHPQRVFVSTSNSGTMQLTFRGPLTTDPLNPAVIATSVPGDAALESSVGVYSAAGSVFPVYENGVFDLTLTLDSIRHYGKIIIDSMTYATTTDARSNVKFKVTVLVQPKPDMTHYAF